MMDESSYSELMMSCDERIASKNRDIKATHKNILFCLLADIKEPMEICEVYMDWTEATLKIVQIEKMIYEAIYAQHKTLLPLLLKKFDECLVETCEIRPAKQWSGWVSQKKSAIWNIPRKRYHNTNL